MPYTNITQSPVPFNFLAASPAPPSASFQMVRNGVGLAAGGCPRPRRSITTNPNAYTEVQSHYALGALWVVSRLSFLEMGSSKGQYFCTKFNFVRIKAR